MLEITQLLAKGSEALECLRLHDIQPTFTQALVGGVISWIALVRLLRWRRYNEIHSKYGPKWNNGKGTITPEEAQVILHLSSFYDLPMVAHYAFSFAIFKTYGVVSSKFFIYNMTHSLDPALYLDGFSLRS